MEKKWNVGSKIELNSLNFERLDESIRTKLTVRKRIFLKDNPDIAMEIENKIKDFISGSTEMEIVKTKGKPDAESDEQE